MIERWLAAIRAHPERPGPLQCHSLTMLALRLDWMDGSGFASVRDVAADASVSGHTVKRATGWASGAGLLLRKRRGHRLGNGQVAASVWQLTVPVDNPKSQGATVGTLTSQGANGASQGANAASQGAWGATHQESSTSSSSSSARASAADTIRAVYPDATDDEIGILSEKVRNNGARNPAAYIAALAANGDLQLPCDRDGTGPHSAACRQGSSGDCATDGNWCTCRCHAQPAQEHCPTSIEGNGQ